MVQFDSLGSKLVGDWLAGPPELPDDEEEVRRVEKHPVGEGAGRGGDPVLLPPAGVEAGEARRQLLPLASRGDKLRETLADSSHNWKLKSIPRTI